MVRLSFLVIGRLYPREISLSLENCALLSYYAASTGNSLPTFRENLWVPTLRGDYPRIQNSAISICFAAELWYHAFLVLSSAGDWVEPRTMLRIKVNEKSQSNPQTLRLVAQCLNQQCHRMSRNRTVAENTNKFKYISPIIHLTVQIFWLKWSEVKCSFLSTCRIFHSVTAQQTNQCTVHWLH